MSLFAIQFCFGATNDDDKFNVYLKWRIILLAYYTCCRLYCNWYSSSGDQLSTVHASSGALPLTCTYDGCGRAGEPVTEKQQFGIRQLQHAEVGIPLSGGIYYVMGARGIILFIEWKYYSQQDSIYSYRSTLCNPNMWRPHGSQPDNGTDQSPAALGPVSLWARK